MWWFDGSKWWSDTLGTFAGVGICFSGAKTWVLVQNQCFTLTWSHQWLPYLMSWKFSMAFSFLFPKKHWHRMMLCWSFAKSCELWTLRCLSLASWLMWDLLGSWCLVLHSALHCYLCDGGWRIKVTSVNASLMLTWIYQNKLSSGVCSQLPWVFQLCSFQKHLLSMNLVHEMVSVVLLQLPDNGSDKLLDWQCTWANLLQIQWSGGTKGLLHAPALLLWMDEKTHAQINCFKDSEELIQ